MKLLKKIAVFGVAACVAVGAAALTACGGDESSGEVTDEQWEEMLSINVENIQSGTFKYNNSSPYPKEQAAQYGKWFSYSSTLFVDLVNEVTHVIDKTERYDAQSGAFKTEPQEEYEFRYKNEYYSWRDYTGDPSQGAVIKITKSDFDEVAQGVANEFATLRTYAEPLYRMIFKYNGETKCYVMQYGDLKASIQFLNGGGVRYSSFTPSALASELEYSAIDKTTIAIPDLVIAAVEAFIAEQQVQ